MSQKVVLTRRRIIEEKVTVKVDAADPADASAAAQHLVDSGCEEWKYSRTVKTSEPCVEVKEESKKEKF